MPHELGGVAGRMRRETTGWPPPSNATIDTTAPTPGEQRDHPTETDGDTHERNQHHCSGKQHPVIRPTRPASLGTSPHHDRAYNVRRRLPKPGGESPRTRHASPGPMRIVRPVRRTGMAGKRANEQRAEDRYSRANSGAPSVSAQATKLFRRSRAKRVPRFLRRVSAAALPPRPRSRMRLGCEADQPDRASAATPEHQERNPPRTRNTPRHVKPTRSYRSPQQVGRRIFPADTKPLYELRIRTRPSKVGISPRKKGWVPASSHAARAEPSSPNKIAIPLLRWRTLWHRRHTPETAVSTHNSALRALRDPTLSIGSGATAKSRSSSNAISVARHRPQLQSSC